MSEFIYKEKQKKSKNTRSFICVLGFLMITIATIQLALFIINRKTPKVKRNLLIDDAQDCVASHEQYALTKQSKLGIYTRAAIAVDAPLCALEGRKILELNGSVVDAAITTGLCDGLLNAQSLGIGGGHFMLIYLKSQKRVIAIDSRETAPSRANETMFVDNMLASYQGGLASGIPGEVAGYWLAHEKAGRLPWKTLIEPIISLAENGFNVSKPLASALNNTKNAIFDDPGLRNIYVNEQTGNLVQENDTIRLTSLAKTLRLIADKGAQAFYDGELSRFIVTENNVNGGLFTLDDLKNFHAKEREPIKIKLNEYLTAYTLPPPSSGILVTFIMQLMKRFNLSKEILTNQQESELYFHRLVESFKHAFAKRSLMGDLDFVNITALKRNLTSDEYIDEIFTKIDDARTFDESYYAPSWSHLSQAGTAHISLVSQDGDAVSLTSTINTYFGAKYAGTVTGIIYNNEMNDFSSPDTENFFHVPPSETNFIRPGKKPMSSMAPLIVVDQNDDVRLVLGASGGTKILSAVAQVALSNLYLGLNIKEAIDLSRLHHQLSPNLIEIENGFDLNIQDSLRNRGHNTSCFNFGGSVLQGVERRPDMQLWANADARKGGETDGF